MKMILRTQRGRAQPAAHGMEQGEPRAADRRPCQSRVRQFSTGYASRLVQADERLRRSSACRRSRPDFRITRAVQKAFEHIEIADDPKTSAPLEQGHQKEALDELRAALKAVRAIKRRVQDLDVRIPRLPRRNTAPAKSNFVHLHGKPPQHLAGCGTDRLSGETPSPSSGPKMTKELLYTTKTKETTAAMPRVVHAHSLLHCTLSKAARACVAAVRAALAVSPEQRDLVRQEGRPLVLWPSRWGCRRTSGAQSLG